jgi:hypothetical protein
MSAAVLCEMPAVSVLVGQFAEKTAQDLEE